MLFHRLRAISFLAVAALLPSTNLGCANARRAGSHPEVALEIQERALQRPCAHAVADLDVGADLWQNQDFLSVIQTQPSDPGAIVPKATAMAYVAPILRAMGPAAPTLRQLDVVPVANPEVDAQFWRGRTVHDDALIVNNGVFVCLPRLSRIVWLAAAIGLRRARVDSSFGGSDTELFSLMTRQDWLVSAYSNLLAFAAGQSCELRTLPVPEDLEEEDRDPRIAILTRGMTTFLISHELAHAMARHSPGALQRKGRRGVDVDAWDVVSWQHEIEADVVGRVYFLSTTLSRHADTVSPGMVEQLLNAFESLSPSVLFLFQEVFEAYSHGESDTEPRAEITAAATDSMLTRVESVVEAARQGEDLSRVRDWPSWPHSTYLSHPPAEWRRELHNFQVQQQLGRADPMAEASAELLVDWCCRSFRALSAAHGARAKLRKR